MPSRPSPAPIRSVPTDRGGWKAAASHDPLPIGGVAVALLLGTYALLDVPVSLPLLGAAFCGAALVYGADRALLPAPEDVWNRPDRVAWVRSHWRWLVVESIVLAGGGAVALAHLRPLTLLAAALLGGVVLLRRWGKKNGWGRPMSLRKPLLVAGVWAMGAVGLPIVEAGAPWTPATLALLGARWASVLSNVLLADWGDRHGDRAVGYEPWAVQYSATAVRWGATFLLVGAVGLLLLGAGAGLPGRLVFVDGMGAGVMGFALWTLDPSRSGHRLVLNLLVGWPAVTALVAWGL